MSMPSGSTADYLVDRRRLRRKVTFWRFLAVLVALLAVIGGAVRGRTNLMTDLTPHIARVKIGGLITGDDETLRLLREVGSSRASALILQIESPGGTTVGSERIYDEIRKVAAKKPVVATVDTLAASGAYIAALGADHIVAYGNSLVGSIGVLFQYPELHRPSRQGRREGRDREILAPQGRAERLRADQRCGPRRDGLAGRRQLRPGSRTW